MSGPVYGMPDMVRLSVVARVRCSIVHEVATSPVQVQA